MSWQPCRLAHLYTAFGAPASGPASVEISEAMRRIGIRRSALTSKSGAGWCVFCGLARNAIWPGRFLRLPAASGDLNRAVRPGHQFFPVFQHVRRHFVITHRHHAPLHLVGERSHAAHRVIRLRLRVRFEKQPALVQNPEEGLARIQSMCAEHRPGAHVRQRAQRVRDKFFKGPVASGESLERIAVSALRTFLPQLENSERPGPAFNVSCVAPGGREVFHVTQVPWRK